MTPRRTGTDGFFVSVLKKTRYVIPGRPQGEPGIHFSRNTFGAMVPGSMLAHRPGMTGKAWMAGTSPAVKPGRVATQPPVA